MIVKFFTKYVVFFQHFSINSTKPDKSPTGTETSAVESDHVDEDCLGDAPAGSRALAGDRHNNYLLNNPLKDRKL
ncbi:hypothetical protein DP114_26235 [Brasilonema sennae CENA114]|uniref:Uncharacterized protein n=2 Tax=Brasilonema TaxID=383614 RepID=A0A856MLE0_9CYAN|nr:hypothetical protein DP114_26235 [Brasilonema sennae CENA114]